MKITNEEEDGREWTATVGTFDSGVAFHCCASRTNEDSLKRSRNSEPSARPMPRQGSRRKDRSQAAGPRAGAAASRECGGCGSRQRLSQAAAREPDRELKKAEAEAKLAEQRAKLDQMRGGGPTPSGGSGSSTMTFRTYELFGVLNGGKVPLSQVVLCDANTGRCPSCQVVA